MPTAFKIYLTTYSLASVVALLLMYRERKNLASSSPVIAVSSWHDGRSSRSSSRR